MFVIIATSIVSGIGFGGQNPVFWAAVRESNAYYNCIDIAVGMINSMTNAAGFVSQFLFGILMDVHWQNIRGGNDFDPDGDRNYSVADYDFAFIAMPICLIAALVFSFFIKETHCKQIEYS